VLQFSYHNHVRLFRGLKQKSTDNKFVLREIKNYNSHGYLTIQEIMNYENDKRELRKFNYEPQKIRAEYKDQTIIWQFNSKGILIKEEHKFKFDGPTTYDFELNERGELIKINDVLFKKSDGMTCSIISDKTNEHLFENIQFNKQENSIQFGTETHKNTLKLNSDGRVTKRTNNYRTVENEIQNNDNWNSFLTTENEPRHLNYTKRSEINSQGRTTIETKYMSSGKIEYEFKEVHYKINNDL